MRLSDYQKNKKITTEKKKDEAILNMNKKKRLS